MKIARQITVFDAADLAAESAFWAGLFGGEVYEDDDFHSVIVDDKWRFGVQLAPNHVPPAWPDGPQQQQVHLDLHVEDIRAAHEHAISLGARLLRAADDFDTEEGHQVYADPAGHPFCLGWHRISSSCALWLAVVTTVALKDVRWQPGPPRVRQAR